MPKLRRRRSGQGANEVKHDIPEDTYNEDLTYCINQFVRNVEHRKILRDWWFHGATLEGLAAKYHMSTTSIKHVVYDIGDRILLRAAAKSRRRQ